TEKCVEHDVPLLLDGRPVPGLRIDTDAHVLGDVYAFCYASLQTRWPERFATPESLAALVDAGKFGTKSGAGYLDVPAERTAELIAYRNRAYVAIKKLMDELGPAPIA
ncbi:hypothetical protein EDF35_0057, partial [Rathayibacter sp. PhB151]